jgi:hypothetical protein
MKVSLWKRLYVSIVLLFTVFLFSCDVLDGFDKDEIGDQWRTGYVTKGSDTIILDAASLKSLSVVKEDGTFIFTQNTDQIKNANIGDILIAVPCPAAKRGALRKIVSINRTGPGPVVSTQAVPMEAAIENCDASLGANLQRDRNQIDEFEALSDGVELLAEDADPSPDRSVVFGPSKPYEIKMTNTLIFDFDGNLGTTKDQIRASGKVSVNPQFEFDIKVIWFKLKEVLVKNKTTETAELIFKNGGMDNDAYAINRSKEIARINFAPITFWLGIFPVVITPSLTVTVDLNGSVKYEFSTGIKQSATLELGAHYLNGSWTPIKNFNNKFSLIAPSLRGEAHLRGALTPRLNLAFYGTVGVYADLKAYLDFTITGEVGRTVDFAVDIPDFKEPDWEFTKQISGSISWNIYAGLIISMGIDINLFGYNLVDYNQQLASWTWTLHKGEIKGSLPY